MKPQPLDLEEFRKWRAKTNPDLTFSISQIEFIKQRLKSACEFWLKEFNDIQKKWQLKVIRDYDYNTPRDIYIDDFQKEVEKLFKLAFKGVME